MCLSLIKARFKKVTAFALALMMAGMVASPAYAETTKGYFGKEVKITHESKERYVSNATFYDYYSDSQVGTSNVANPITDALKSAKVVAPVNTFQKFNNVLLNTMKYSDDTLTSTLNPLYQGYFALQMTNENSGGIKKTDNFDLDNHGGWFKSSVEQGLVESKLYTDSQGNTFLTQSNPKNGNSSKLPYFDKDLLTSTKFDNSELTIGSVKEKVSFPFRKVEEDNVVYYEFDSSKDVVRFDSEGNLEYKGTSASEQVKDANGKVGFFPYNSPADSKSNSLNFGFGAKIQIPFTTTSDGKLGKKDITFEFSGDDDVWVFIDGQLALDMGGGHKVIEGSINFADLKVTVDGKKSKLSDTVKTIVRDTSKTHTLTLFYLERGEWQSNMKLKFNLPEPNNMTVSNEVKTTNVNPTFADLTNAAIANERFIVGLTDKNLNEYDEQELANKEYVSYTDEFKYNDTMQLKLTGLKDTNRKISDLYNTTYTLSDPSTLISKKNNVQVSDGRAKTNDAFVFRNKCNDSSPFLITQYVNEVATGTFELTNSVSSIKDKNDDFEYIVSYKNVFGVASDATFYKGEYTVETIAGKTYVKTTADGKIVLKANEKAIIKGIPTKTTIGVQCSKLIDGYKVEAIDKTSNFAVDEASYIAYGDITKKNNEVIYAIKAENGTKVDTIVDKENKESKKNKKNEDPNAMDKSPDTSDSFNIMYFVICLVAAIILTGSASVIIRKKSNK